MRINELRECVVLAETLSFTETARRLYTTQSALSKHIQSIEQELDVELFMRNQHGVHLTQAGRMFVAHAQDIVQRYDETLVSVKRVKSGIDSALRVGYLAGASAKFLPRAINWFTDAHPTTDLQFSTMEIDHVVEGLDQDEIDIGITTELVKFSKARYVTLPLYKDHIAVVVPRGHRLAQRNTVSVRDLAGETLLLPNATFMTKEAPIIDDYLTPVKDKVLIKKNISDIQGVFLLMMTNRYVTVIFEHLRNYNDFSERFSFLRLEEAQEDFDIVAVWKRSKETEAIVEFADMLKESTRIAMADLR